MSSRKSLETQFFHPWPNNIQLGKNYFISRLKQCDYVFIMTFVSKLVAGGNHSFLPTVKMALCTASKSEY